MNRSEKQTFVSYLSDEIKTAEAVAVMSFSGLTVEKMTSFRLNLRKNHVRVKVVKNTLARKVFKDTPYEAIISHFSGPTLIAYSKKDSIEAAKIICDWTGKEDFDVKLKSGIALGQVMSVSQIQALSKLPGRNEMFVGFLWALKSGPTKFLYALQDTPKRLGYALGALQEKKQKESA